MEPRHNVFARVAHAPRFFCSCLKSAPARQAQSLDPASCKPELTPTRTRLLPLPRTGPGFTPGRFFGVEKRKSDDCFMFDNAALSVFSRAVSVKWRQSKTGSTWPNFSRANCDEVDYHLCVYSLHLTFIPKYVYRPDSTVYCRDKHVR